MTNLRAFVFALPLAAMLSGCPIYGGDGDPPVPDCRRDSDCGPGLMCFGGECLAELPCVEDFDCDSGGICVAGSCRPTNRCDTDAQCRPGTICEAGICTPGDRGCSANGDCANAKRNSASLERVSA